MEFRKEIDTLAEEEDRERLQQDCAAIRNIKGEIRQQFVKRLEEQRLEFIKTNNIHKEEQTMVNRVFKWLKERA